MRTVKRRTRSLCLAVLMLCLTVLPTAAQSVESATAATMQLMKTEGTVDITNASTRSLSYRDNMRLYNGYHLETKAKSYAWINLDSTKLAKLDAVSEAEVRKSGKVLEILLNSGNFYFNVTSPLESDETLNIRTSTMAVGIRGTCGWFKMIDRWEAEIYVLEGTVQCTVTDPVTDQTKVETIHSGEKAIATVYPQEQEGDKCDITYEKIEVSEIAGFVLAELAEDPGLCGDIYDAAGLDVLPPMGLLESIRRELEEIREELDEIREELEDGGLSLEDARTQMDGLREQMQDMRDRLAEAAPQDDTQRRLDDAQNHLQQARDALDEANPGTTLDRLEDARQDLEGAQRQGAASARQQAAGVVQDRLEQEQRQMQETLEVMEERQAGQEGHISTEPVWEGGSSASGTASGASSPSTTPGGSGTVPGTPALDILAALRNAANGEVVTLTEDVRTAAAANVNISHGTVSNPVVLDLNGHSLTVTDSYDFNITGALEIRDSAGGGTIAPGGTIRAQNGGRLSLTGGTVNGGGPYVTCVSAVSGSTITMSGGTINGSGSNTQTVYAGGGSSFTMTGGAIHNIGASYGVNLTGNSSFSLNGGTIDGGSQRAVNCENSTFTMNSGTVTSANPFATVYQSGSGGVRRGGGTISNTGGGVNVYVE